jgi:hypothetical protein
VNLSFKNVRIADEKNDKSPIVSLQFTKGQNGWQPESSRKESGESKRQHSKREYMSMASGGDQNNLNYIDL